MAEAEMGGGTVIRTPLADPTPTPPLAGGVPRLPEPRFFCQVSVLFWIPPLLVPFDEVPPPRGDGVGELAWKDGELGSGGRCRFILTADIGGPLGGTGAGEPGSDC